MSLTLRFDFNVSRRGDNVLASRSFTSAETGSRSRSNRWQTRNQQHESSTINVCFMRFVLKVNCQGQIIQSCSKIDNTIQLNDKFITSGF